MSGKVTDLAKSMFLGLASFAIRTGYRNQLPLGVAQGTRGAPRSRMRRVKHGIDAADAGQIMRYQPVIKA